LDADRIPLGLEQDPGDNDDEKNAETKENSTEHFFAMMRVAQRTASCAFRGRTRNP